MGKKDVVEGTVPYKEVFDEYAGRAGTAMERDNVPDTIRSAVEKYFSSLG